MDGMLNQKYQITELNALINKLDEVSAKRIWMYRVAFLECLNIYYKYSVAATLLYEELTTSAFRLSYKAHSDEKNDLDYKAHSCAISAYNHMRICISCCKEITNNALQSSETEEGANKLQNYRVEGSKICKKIIDIRIDIGAHPDQLDNVITSPTGWDTDGGVTYTPIDIHNLKGKKEILLEPSKHLQELKIYIQGLAPLIENCWYKS